VTASPRDSASPRPGLAWGRGCQPALSAVLLFAGSTVVLSLLFSAVAHPFVQLEWWRVFRRCVSISAFLSLWWLTRLRERRPLTSYGLAPSPAGKRQLRFGLLLGACGLAVMLGLGLASGTCRVDISPDRVKLWRTVAGFLPAALLVGLLEELVFRGYLLQRMLPCSRPGALVLSSAAYALVHLKHPTMTLLTWMELGGLFLFGMVLAYSYFVTGQLWLAVGLHSSLAYGARVNKVVVSFQDSSIGWLVGTSRLVNGLAGWMALAAIAGIIGWWAKRGMGGATHGTN